MTCTAAIQSKLTNSSYNPILIQFLYHPINIQTMIHTSCFLHLTGFLCFTSNFLTSTETDLTTQNWQILHKVIYYWCSNDFYNANLIMLMTHQSCKTKVKYKPLEKPGRNAVFQWQSCAALRNSGDFHYIISIIKLSVVQDRLHKITELASNSKTSKDKKLYQMQKQ